MAENPLLPHAQLRALYALMVRCRALERQRKTAQTVAREALLAATAMQLQPGDLLCAEPGDPTPAHLAPQATGPHRSGELTLPAALAGRLALCAATARGLQAAATAKESGIVLAYTRARAAEPGWEKALAWAQAAQLPLLLACADATGGRVGTRTAHGALDWASITRLHQSSKLAVISVDGEDAVALYRVMQECVLRARLGGGPAVLWAVMNPAHSLARAQQPVARLRSYMATRGIALG